MTHLSHFQMVTASLIGILSVARTARLLVWDEYPPTVWLRIKWDDTVGPHGWGKLLHCQFCLTPWLALGLAGWAWLSDLNYCWWIINGIWAASYVAASVVAYDQPED